MNPEWEWPIVFAACGVLSLILTTLLFKKERKAREKRILHNRLEDLARREA